MSGYDIQAPTVLGSDEKILSQGFCASLSATQPAGRVVVVVHVGLFVWFWGLCFVGHVAQVPNIEWAVESPVLLSMSLLRLDKKKKNFWFASRHFKRHRLTIISRCGNKVAADQYGGWMCLGIASSSSFLAGSLPHV